MQSVNSFYAFSNATEAGESTPTGNSQADSLYVQVEGPATAVSLQVLGLVDFIKPNEYTALMGANMNDFTTSTTITGKGIYMFPIDGVAQFKLKLTSVTGGAVSVFCRTTKGV